MLELATPEQQRWGVGVRPAVKKGKPEAEITWLYLPTVKQAAFHACPAKNALYGGAAGGGKSHALRWDFHRRCLYQPGYRALLLRRTWPELEHTHLEAIELEVKAMGATFLKSERKVIYANGSIFQFGHCEDDASLSKFLSTEYDAIGFDELVTFTERQFLLISSRARTGKPGTMPVVRAGTNPGGAGSHWVKSLFLDKVPDLVAYPHYDASDWVYIPATLEDNPHIDQVAYDQRLSMLPEALRRAYRDGDWDLFEGQYFTEWRRAVHVLSEAPALPRSIERIRAVDWGYLKPGVCLWVAMQPDGRLVVEDEYLFRETTAKEVAKEIARRTSDLGVTVRYSVADPAMWIRDGQTGESIAETFARNGVSLIKADHERTNGWQRLRHWLRPSPDGRPWLQSSPACTYLNRTLPALVYDMTKEWRGEPDVDTRGEDHAADALRYAVMSRPMPTRDQPREVHYKPGTLGWLRQQVDRGTRTVLGLESVRRSA